MKHFKQYLSAFLALIAICSILSVPVARSYLATWDYYEDAVYYQNMIKVDTKILEDVSNGVKSNVRVQSINISPCYVKAMIVFTALDKNNNPVDLEFNVKHHNSDNIDDADVLLTFPTENEASHSWLTINEQSDLINQYSNETGSLTLPYSYIYSAPLLPNEVTSNLIDKVECLETGCFSSDSEYKLRVDIITDSVYEGEINQWIDITGYNITVKDRILSVN